MSTIICCIAGLLLGWFVVHPFFEGMRRVDRNRAELAMARLMIAELAPKAQAWDVLIGGHKPNWNDVTTAQAPAPAPADDYRVAYAHLSAECDGCEEVPARARNHCGWQGLA